MSEFKIKTFYQWVKQIRKGKLCLILDEENDPVETQLKAYALQALTGDHAWTIYEAFANLKIKITLRDSTKVRNEPVTAVLRNLLAEQFDDYMKASVKEMFNQHYSYGRIFNYCDGQMTSEAFDDLFEDESLRQSWQRYLEGREGFYALRMLSDMLEKETAEERVAVAKRCVDVHPRLFLLIAHQVAEECPEKLSLVVQEGIDSLREDIGYRGDLAELGLRKEPYRADWLIASFVSNPSMYTGMRAFTYLDGSQKLKSIIASIPITPTNLIDDDDMLLENGYFPRILYEEVKFSLLALADGLPAFYESYLNAHALSWSDEIDAFALMMLRPNQPIEKEAEAWLLQEIMPFDLSYDQCLKTFTDYQKKQGLKESTICALLPRLFRQLSEQLRYAWRYEYAFRYKRLAAYAAVLSQLEAYYLKEKTMQDYLDDIVSGGPQKEEWQESLSQVLRPFDEESLLWKDESPL